MVELLFLPSVYAPCPVCHGARYNEETLEVKVREKSIADVLGMTVDAACEFFADEPQVLRSLNVLGRPELHSARPACDRALRRRGHGSSLRRSAQRIQRGDTLYVLDEPTTGFIHRTSINSRRDSTG